MQANRSLARFASWSLLAKIASVAGILFVNAVLARSLPQDEMGSFFLLSSVVTFLAIFARLGTRQAIVRLVAESVARHTGARARQAVLKCVLVVALFGSACAYAYYVSVGTWIGNHFFDSAAFHNTRAACALWLFVLTLQTPVAEAFRGLHDVRAAVFLDGVLSQFLLGALCVIFVATGRPLNIETVCWLSAVVVASVIASAVPALYRRMRTLRGAGAVGFAEIYSIAMPMLVVNLAGGLGQHVSLWIVGAFVSAPETALYGSAWRLVQFVVLPLALINMSAQSIIVDLHSRAKYSELQRLLTATATLTAIPALFATVVFLVFGDSILALIYGHKYSEAYLMLILLSAGQLGNVLTGSSAHLLTFSGNQAVLMKVTVLSSIVTIVLALSAGLTGSLLIMTAAFALGAIVQNGMLWWAAKRATSISTMARLSHGGVVASIRYFRR